MIPIQQLELLATMLHQERIQNAQRRRPEWMYAPLLLSDCAQQESNANRSLHRMIAQSLYRVAARWRRTNLAEEPGH
jgi:hypothetical protein